MGIEISNNGAIHKVKTVHTHRNGVIQTIRNVFVNNSGAITESFGDIADLKIYWYPYHLAQTGTSSYTKGDNYYQTYSSGAGSSAAIGAQIEFKKSNISAEGALIPKGLTITLEFRLRVTGTGSNNLNSCEVISHNLMGDGGSFPINRYHTLTLTAGQEISYYSKIYTYLSSECTGYSYNTATLFLDSAKITGTNNGVTYNNNIPIVITI